MNQESLFPSEPGTIIAGWNNRSQVRLAWLFPGETNTVVPERHWYDFFQVTLERPFLSGTTTGTNERPAGTTVPLAQLFSSVTGTVVPKWH